jgi:AcrR family transcriptional regulator
MGREISDNQLQIMSNFDVKLSILEAMERLLPEIPMRKLTVMKICEEAGISHASFYRYFKDKFAVAQWHVRYTQIQGVDKIGRTLNWHDGYTITEQLMLEHPRFYEGASQSDDYNGIDAFSSRIRRKVLRDTVTEFKKTELTDSLKFQIDAAVDMEIHAFPRWQDGEYDIPLETMVNWIVKALPRGIFELLDTPTMPQSADLPANRAHPDGIWRPHSKR